MGALAVAPTRAALLETRDTKVTKNLRLTGCRILCFACWLTCVGDYHHNNHLLVENPESIITLKSDELPLFEGRRFIAKITFLATRSLKLSNLRSSQLNLNEVTARSLRRGPGRGGIPLLSL